MRKSIGNKMLSLSVSTYDGKNLKPGLERLFWDFLEKSRMVDRAENLDALGIYLLYCSYISRNYEDLSIKDFDEQYSIDSVEKNLGNDYLVRDLLAYYSCLDSDSCHLPKLNTSEFVIEESLQTIKLWVQLLNKSGLSLLEDDDFSVAQAIYELLTSNTRISRLSAIVTKHNSFNTISKLVTSLVNVQGKTVLDFACGEASFLGESAVSDASSIYGRASDERNAELAKIIVFFANPKCHADIAVSDSILMAYASINDHSFDRVLLSPPSNTKLYGLKLEIAEYMGITNPALSDDTKMISVQFEDFCIAEAIRYLAKDGLAVIHVPSSFLFQRQRNRQLLRKVLLEAGCVQAVIELPGGALPGTSVKTALLVLGKTKRFDDVLIVDFDSKDLVDSGYYVKGRTRILEITEQGIDWLTNLVNSREEIPRVSALVDIQEIIANESNLCFSSYGEVFDLESSLKKIRSAFEIAQDANAANEIIATKSRNIDELLETLA